MATLAQEQRDGDVLKSKLSVSFRTEEWSKPWIAQAPGPARWRVFPGRDGGLHVFAIIAGPKGQTVWYGRPGQSARVVAGPIDLDGKGMQPSGRGVHLVETQAEAVAILETQRGIQRLELSAGKPTPLVRHERKRSVNEGTGRVVQVDVQPIFVGLLSTDHDARLVYRTRTQTKEFEQDKDPRRGPPRDREVSRTSTERVFVHNPLGGQPHEVKVEGYVARAARTPGGGIWLVGERKNGDSADLLVHVLTDGPLGPTAPISAFDYGAASTDGVKLEFDSEAELMAAGFQRWGVGTSTFSKGRMKVVSQGYEEWFSAASSGLLRGKIGKGYVLKARLRVIEQYKKGMDPARVAHLPNVGVRLGGPFGSASFQVASSRVILTYEGQSTAVSVDGSQMNSFQLAVFSSGKAILYRGGIEIARLVRPLGAPRTDAVHIAVGALGGSVGVTAEFDELEVSNIPK